ncbi:MAG: TolC family protein [Pirellulaceae bacterium]
MPTTPWKLTLPFLFALMLVWGQGPLSPLQAEPPSPVELSPAPLESLGQQVHIQVEVESFEYLARLHHPGLQVAQARIRAAEGVAIQAGLPLNPTIGYAGDQIGDDGTSGMQGIGASQVWQTAGKRMLAREVELWEVEKARQEFAMMEQRVLTDVRRAYFQVLLTQRQIDLAREITRLNRSSVEVIRKGVEGQQQSRATLLQSEIEAERIALDLARFEETHRFAWKNLIAVVGAGELPVVPLTGDPEKLLEPLEWNSSLARLQSQSPQVAKAMSEIQRARSEVALQNANRYSDIETEVLTQYNVATQEMNTGVGIGMELRLWDRNQGSIMRARAELMASQRQLEVVHRQLESALSEQFSEYRQAELEVRLIQEKILPRSRELMQLVHQAEGGGEAGQIDVLIARQVLVQGQMEYLVALANLWDARWRIEGFLLEGALWEE